LDHTSCIPEISSSFLMTSLLVLSSFVYPLTILRKRISAASRRVMSRVVVTNVTLPQSSGLYNHKLQRDDTGRLRRRYLAAPLPGLRVRSLFLLRMLYPLQRADFSSREILPDVRVSQDMSRWENNPL